MIGRFTGWLLWKLPAGAFLLALAAVLFLIAVPPHFATPEELPDFDYLPLARELAAKGDYEECIQLCEDIVAHDLPNSERAIRLLAECESRRSSQLRQLRLFFRGFFTGDASSFDSAAGAVVSDLTLYGDVRDLGVQGWRYVTGGETDLFIVTFSSVGLVTELADFVDWFPAVLKAFRRAGVFSRRFSKVLIDSARALCSSGPARRTARGFFGDLANFMRRSNLRRAKAVLRGADSAADLKVLLRAAEKSPGKLHLASRSVGTRKLVSALKEMPSPRTLELAARKGPDGLTALRTLRKIPGRRYLKWGARLGKAFHTRRIAKLMEGVFAKVPSARLFCLGLAGVSFVTGVLVLLPRRKKRERRISDPSSGASAAPSSSSGPASPTEDDPPGSGRD